MSYDDTPPTVKQELERKTVDLLQVLVHRAETHRMDRADLAAVGRVLWSITSGLVDNSVSGLCAAVADAGKPRRLARHFVGKGSVVTVTWLADKNGYAVVTRNAADPAKTQVRPFNAEIGVRENELQTLFDTLAKSGYVELT